VIPQGSSGPLLPVFCDFLADLSITKMAQIIEEYRPPDPILPILLADLRVFAMRRTKWARKSADSHPIGPDALIDAGMLGHH
jgi:hypothetical protein